MATAAFSGDDTHWDDDAGVTVINPPGLDGGENTPWHVPPRPTHISSATAATTPGLTPWPTASPPAVAANEPARVVGRYAMYEEIARGGMASVHLGRSIEPGIRQAVAIKRMFPQLAANPNFVAMFLDEGRLAARVRHPNVVAPLDFVVRAAEGELYLVMEYLHGETLAHLLTRSVRQGQAPSPEVAVGIMVGVLRGLHAAHEATTEDGTSLEIVHRDVSPQNIMVGADGVARVLDFGVARATVQDLPMDEDERPGKPSYLAPEQIRGGSVDRRSDVFSAAVVLWELLARRRLFRHGNPHVVSMKILAGEVPPPSHFNPEVSTALDAALLRALERKRDNRYPTARAFADAILAVLPPAAPTAISAWVEQVSGDLLALRAERVAEIVSGPRKLSPLRWRSMLKMSGSEPRWRQLMGAAPRRRRGTPVMAHWLPWGGGLVAMVLAGLALWSTPGRAVGPRTTAMAPPAAASRPLIQVVATAAAAAPVPAPQAAPVPAPQAALEPKPQDEPEVAPAAAPPPAVEPAPAPRERVAARDQTIATPRRGHARAMTLTAIETMNRRALVAYRRGDYANAHGILRTALATALAAQLREHPLTAITRTHLGAVLAAGFRQPELAVEQFRQALRIDPTMLLPRVYGKPQVAAAFRKAAART